MRRAAIALTVGAAAYFLAAPAAARTLRFRIDGGYPASLCYVVDNLSGAGVRAYPYYGAFWRREFGLDAGDEAALRRYERLRARVAAGGGETDRWERMSAGARTLDEVGARAAAILGPADGRALREILARFDARFRPYWDQHGPSVLAVAEQARSSEALRRARDFLEKVADFFELQRGLRRTYDVELLWHPGLAASGNVMHGRRVGTVMLVEMPEGCGFEDQIDVVVHELVHDLYASRPAAARAETSRRVLEADRRSGLFFLEGMNEGLATALGQGLFMSEAFPKRFRRDGDWYESDVDAFAKAVYPRLRESFARRATLRLEAAELAAATAPLARSAKAPSFFRSHVLLTDAATDALFDELLSAVDAGRVRMFSPNESPGQAREARRFLDADPAEPAIALVEPGSLREPLTSLLDGAFSAARLAAAAQAALARPLAVFGRSRSGRPCLLIVGAVGSLRGRLSSLKSIEFSEDAAVDLIDARPVAL